MLPSLARVCAVASARSLRPRPCNSLVLHARPMSTPPPMVKTSELSSKRYDLLSDTAMENLLSALENLVDSIGNSAYEVEYHSGVLTLRLGDKGTYVINKQPPNKQIWLSSPFSGPKRYDYHVEDKAWVYSRDGQSLPDLLNKELSAALERPVDVAELAD